MLYLIKLEEGPELLLGTGGRPLSVWAVTLSLGIAGGGAISLRNDNTKDIEMEDFTFRFEWSKNIF